MKGSLKGCVPFLIIYQTLLQHEQMVQKAVLKGKQKFIASTTTLKLKTTLLIFGNNNNNIGLVNILSLSKDL